MTTETWISTIGIFAALVISSYGRKLYNPKRLLIPVGILFYFGSQYLSDIPTTGNNLLLLGTTTLFGAGIGVILLIQSRVEYSNKAGAIYITTGIKSILILAAVFIGRTAMIEWITHNSATAYRFALNHQFDLNILGPLFIFMAGAMVLVRVVGIFIKVDRVKQLNYTA